MRKGKRFPLTDCMQGSPKYLGKTLPSIGNPAFCLQLCAAVIPNLLTHGRQRKQTLGKPCCHSLELFQMRSCPTALRTWLQDVFKRDIGFDNLSLVFNVNT